MCLHFKQNAPFQRISRDNRPAAWHPVPVIPQAVILLGGKGTRIAAHFPDVPKALVPVNGRPFLEWQLDGLRASGITQVLLAAGHKAEVLEAYLTTRPDDGLEIVLSREPTPLGTGGAVKFIEPQLTSDPFLVLNGDSITPNLDFSMVWKKDSTIFHGMEEMVGSGPRMPLVPKRDLSPQERGQSVRETRAPWCGKLFATPIEDPGRYGTVEFQEDGTVTAFREKAERASGYVNTGIYLLPRAMLDALPSDSPISLETEVFPSLVEKKQLLAIPAPAPLLDMGTPDGLAAMESFLRG
jgi:NDP-sugar pyrophosphorylase family protein